MLNMEWRGLWLAQYRQQGEYGQSSPTTDHNVNTLLAATCVCVSRRAARSTDLKCSFPSYLAAVSPHLCVCISRAASKQQILTFASASERLITETETESRSSGAVKASSNTSATVWHQDRVQHCAPLAAFVQSSMWTLCDGRVFVSPSMWPSAVTGWHTVRTSFFQQNRHFAQWSIQLWTNTIKS